MTNSLELLRSKGREAPSSVKSMTSKAPGMSAAIVCPAAAPPEKSAVIESPARKIEENLRREASCRNLPYSSGKSQPKCGISSNTVQMLSMAAYTAGLPQPSILSGWLPRRACLPRARTVSA